MTTQQLSFCTSIETKIFPDHLPKAKVSRVVDGDSVYVVLNRSRILVRLSAIDSPEDGQEFSSNAKGGLIKLIGGREVFLESYGPDIHGRTLATIYVATENGLLNVNERMVTLGNAWVYRRFYTHLSDDRKLSLDLKEDWARNKRRGLWQNEKPVAPWSYRYDESRQRA